MTTADELTKLHDLYIKGALSQVEFEQAKARLLATSAAAVPAAGRFRLSTADRWVGGVCGGLGVLTQIESWIWRLIVVLGSVFSGGFLAIFYIALWIFAPRDDR